MTYLFRRMFTSFSRRPATATIVLTIVWLAVCVWCVSARIGWGALGTFLPHELGGFFAGVFAPPAFLWLLVAYLRRSADFNETAGQIRKGMSRLTYPADESADRVEVISEALARQADMLSAATERAAEQAQILRDVLEDHTSRLEKASDIAGTRAGQAQDVMRVHASELERASESAADRVREMTAGMRHQLQDLTDASDRAAEATATAA